jgi:hypothetical protein
MECPVCAIEISTKYNLKRHIQAKHPDRTIVVNEGTIQVLPLKKPHKCNTCYKSFASIDSLEQHFDKCLSLSSPLECAVCHAIFPYRKALSRHRKKMCEGSLVNQVRDFGDENINYITPDFVMKCVEAGTQGIGMMLDHVFFHPDHHENRTVSIEGKRRSCSARVHKQNEWVKRGLSVTYKDMVDKARNIILTLLQTYQPGFESNPDNAKTMFQLAAFPIHIHRPLFLQKQFTPRDML